MNDDVHDPAFPVRSRSGGENKAVALASSGCALASGADQQRLLPSPCGAISISGYSDVANCLVCIAESESSIADNSAYGTPPPAPPVLNQKCQIQVGKAFQKYSDTRAKVQQTCQFAEDISPLGTNCRIADPKGTVAKAVIKLKLSIAKCTDAGLAGLDSCGNNVNGEQSCIQGATELMVDNLFADVYTPAGTSAVFVSSNVGTPGGSGTIASPVDTITGGLSIAIGSGAANVFIDGGAYSESLSLVSGINLVGGFNSAGGWIHDGSATTVFGGTTGLLGSLVADVVVDGLSVHAAGNTGGPARTASALGSTNVMIKRAGRSSPVAVAPHERRQRRRGFAGGVGGNGGGARTRPSSATAARGPAEGSGPGAICNGGGGGGGGEAADARETRRRAAPVAAAATDRGGGLERRAAPAERRARGFRVASAPGNAGSDESGGAASAAVAPHAGQRKRRWRQLVRWRWRRQRRRWHSVCDSWGGGGGGGGGGGCGGGGGGAGGGGGGSFGIWIDGGNATVVGVTIQTGNGGNGGGGGSGGTPGGGGGGGANGGGEDDSGPGAGGRNGGNGGRGGHGGGGGGGPSIGIACVSGGAAATSSNVFTVGASGSGGSSPANPGATGRNANTSGC